MTPTICAYIAGLIDGEGSIGIFISRSPSRSNAAVLARLKIGMCDEPLIRWLHRVTNSGTVTSWRQHHPRWKPVWVMTWNGHAAAILLKQVLPYLRIKHPQAKLLLRWVKISRSWRSKLGGRGHYERQLPAHVWRTAEHLGAEVRRLNMRGTPPS